MARTEGLIAPAALGLSLALFAVGSAEAAPFTFACPDVLGADLLVADVEVGRAQIVGDNLLRRSPNYGITLVAEVLGSALVVRPPLNPGGGAYLPGTEATQFRIENGNFVSEEYAIERTLGTCATTDPAAFVEQKFPAPEALPGTALACAPFDTTAPAPEQWTPLPEQAFVLTFDGGKVMRQDGDAAPVEYAAAFEDSGEKITFSTADVASPGGFALNRYSGNLFQTTDLGYSAGRLVATCAPQE